MIHSSVDGLWGCFYFVAIMNNATTNIYIQVFVQTPMFTILSGIYPRLELVSHMINSFSQIILRASSVLGLGWVLRILNKSGEKI